MAMGTLSSRNQFALDKPDNGNYAKKQKVKYADPYQPRLVCADSKHGNGKDDGMINHGNSSFFPAK